MATSSIWYSGSSSDSQSVSLGALSVNILALTYAGLIGFERSTIHFERTKKTWKLALLLALTIAGLLLVLIRGFSITFLGHVLAGWTLAFCLLWFDSDVKREMALGEG